MAKALPSPLLTSITGRVGGVQFASTSAGLHIRNRPSRRGQRSVPLIAAQADLVALRKGWIALSDAQRLSWRQLGLQMTKTDRLAQSRRPSGIETYMMYLSYWHRFAPGVAAFFPTATVTDQPLSAIAGFVTAPYYAVSVTYTPARLNVYCGLYGALSFGLSPPKSSQQHTFFGSVPADGAQHQITSDWNSVLPIPQAGQYISVRFVCQEQKKFPAAAVFHTSQASV